MRSGMIQRKRRLLCLGMSLALLCVSCTGEKSLQDYEKGVLAYEAADYEKAAEYFEAALDKNPDKAEYYLYYGYALMELGQYEEAKTQFEKAMLDKEIESIRDNTKRAYRAAGIAAYYQGDWQQAMIYLHLAYQMEELPELNEDIKAYMQQIELERIDYYLGTEAIENAAELCAEIEESYGESGVVWIAKGNIAYARKDYKEAAECYEAAVLAGEDTVTTRIALIANLQCVLRLEEVSATEEEEILAKIEEVLAVLRTMTPADEDEQERMGLIFFAAGDYDMAEQWLGTLTVPEGSNKNWNSYLAQIAIAKKEYVKALQLLQTRSESELTADTYYQMAFCAAKSKESELAQSYYEAGLKLLQPEADMQRWDRLGIYLLEQSQEYEAAYKELEAYVEDYLTLEDAEWEAMQKELKYLNYRK